MVSLILGRVAEFGFAAHPISRGGFPVFYRIFTGSPAVGREIVVKAFRIRIASFDRRKIIFDYFERGDDKRRAFGSPLARLVRAFFTLDREFLFICSVLIYSILIVIKSVTN